MAQRVSSSESDPLHHRPMTDRSPKLGDRSTHSEPLNQKKLGTRIAELETQLEQAQGELKILKDQLASAEAAKKEAQKELENRTNKPLVSEPVVFEPAVVVPVHSRSSPSEIGQENETPDENQKETDVFEVPIEVVNVSQPRDQDEVKVKVNISPKSDEEISSLKATIEENKTELRALQVENEGLKVKEEKMSQKLTHLEEELTKSKTDGIRLREKMKEIQDAKDALETEMKRLRVQTEQWRKAADAGAAILSGEVEMDKHYGGVFDGFVGMGDESDDVFGNGKRKGSGMRVFGDLWKKKGQK